MEYKPCDSCDYKDCFSRGWSKWWRFCKSMDDFFNQDDSDVENIEHCQDGDIEDDIDTDEGADIKAYGAVAVASACEGDFSIDSSKSTEILVAEATVSPKFPDKITSIFEKRSLDGTRVTTVNGQRNFIIPADVLNQFDDEFYVWVTPMLSGDRSCKIVILSTAEVEQMIGWIERSRQAKRITRRQADSIKRVLSPYLQRCKKPTTKKSLVFCPLPAYKKRLDLAPGDHILWQTNQIFGNISGKKQTKLENQVTQEP